MKKFLILFIAIFFYSCNLLDTNYHDNLRDPVLNYEQFWKDLNDYYGLIDFKSDKHLIGPFGGWEGLYRDHKRYIHRDMSERELFAVLSSVLFNLNDAHAYWISDRAPSFYNSIPTDNDYPHPSGISWASESEEVLPRHSYGHSGNYRDLRIPKEYLSNSKYYEDGIIYGGIIDLYKVETFSPTLEDLLDKSKRYGYISISSFIKYNDLKNFNAAQNWSRKIDLVLDDLSQTDGLILDVRHNSGGYEGNLEVVLSRFVDRYKKVYVSYVRDGSNRDSFTRVEYYSSPTVNAYTNKIVILTDRGTSSCGDLFALSLKGQANVSIVGQNTHGIFSKVITRELPIGWSFRISTGYTLDIHGINYEELGVYPDFNIPKESVVELYDTYSSNFYFYDPIFISGVKVLDFNVAKGLSKSEISSRL